MLFLSSGGESWGGVAGQSEWGGGRCRQEQVQLKGQLAGAWGGDPGFFVPGSFFACCPDFPVQQFHFLF